MMFNSRFDLKHLAIWNHEYSVKKAHKTPSMLDRSSTDQLSRGSDLLRLELFMSQECVL